MQARFRDNRADWARNMDPTALLEVATISCPTPTSPMSSVSPPFAVNGGFDVSDSVRFVSIARDSPIENQRRYGIEATGQNTSTGRFRVHSPQEQARSLLTNDIPAASPGSTRNIAHSLKFGRDNKDTSQPYHSGVQQEVGAQPALHEKASTTGVLGDARSGGALPHRSASYKYTHKGNPGILDIADIEGAQPGEANLFLKATQRHTNPMSPEYRLATSPPRTSEIPKTRRAVTDSLDVTDIRVSDTRHQYGTPWTAEKKDCFMLLNRDRKAGLGKSDGKSAKSPVEEYPDVAGASPGTTRHCRLLKEFGRDSRNPLGTDLDTFIGGPSCPGVSGP